MFVFCVAAFLILYIRPTDARYDDNQVLMSCMIRHVQLHCHCHIAHALFAWRICFTGILKGLVLRRVEIFLLVI